MSQHLLDGVQVGAVGQEVGREGVPQGVGGDLLLDLGLVLVIFDDLPEPLAAHALTAHVDEQRLLPGVQDQLGPDVGRRIR